MGEGEVRVVTGETGMAAAEAWVVTGGHGWSWVVMGGPVWAWVFCSGTASKPASVKEGQAQSSGGRGWTWAGDGEAWVVAGEAWAVMGGCGGCG